LRTILLLSFVAPVTLTTDNRQFSTDKRKFLFLEVFAFALDAS